MVVQDLLVREGTDDKHLETIFLYQGHFKAAWSPGILCKHGAGVSTWTCLDGMAQILGF